MERNSDTLSTPSDPAAPSRTYSSKKLVNFINEEKTLFKPQNIVRPVQRAWNQDDTMDFYEEADALPPGGIRLKPSDAPMTSGQALVAVKALEEAPDGYRRLDWSGQGMTDLPDVPAHFKNARVVLVNDNKLPAFPQELADMRLMQTLRIDSNSITTVPHYIHNFTLLEQLRASDNSISSISANIGRCKQLVSLDLQRNNLESLPQSIGACVNLQKLWLTQNRIAKLPFTLSHLHSLRSLRVDKNQLEEFGFNIVRLTKLNQLRAGHNRIKHLPEDIGFAPKLRELCVNNNEIMALPPSICKLKLDRLALDSNPLKRPPAEVTMKGMQHVFIYLKRLMYAVETWDLDLSNFNLTNIPFPSPDTSALWDLQTWERLKILSIPNNKLFVLPLEMYLMTNLTILDLCNNGLSTIPPSVGSLTNLQVLDASGNNIQALPRQMSSNINLTELLLENNRCTSVPPVVIELQALTDLRLTSNRIPKLIDSIGNAKNITVLHLEHNEIKFMPHGMSRLYNLKILKMSHNVLMEVPGSFVKIRPLSDPPTHIAPEADAQSQALGTLLDPRVRRTRVREVLFGGARKPHRSIPRIPLPEREWEKPPGAGKRRGWDLVRFALFGENGPHLKRPIKDIMDDEKVKGADDSSSSGEESESAPAEDENNEKKPAKVGFVHRLRSVFGKKEKDENEKKPKDGEKKKGAKEQGDKGKEAEGDQAEPKKEGEGAAPEAKVGFLGGAVASFKQFTQRFQKQPKKKDNDLGDDFGAYCRCLVELDLSYNIIEKLPTDFGNISTLTKLNLAHNRLEKVPRSMITLEKMLELNLSDNIFMDAPAELGKMKSLEKLDLSRQGKGDLLQNLPGVLQGLELLRELRLSGNNFSYLPDCICSPEMDGSIIKKPGMTALQLLTLDNNPLLGLDENLAICHKMEKLLVHNTKIRRLNKSITFMYRLQEIWLSGTNIRHLDLALATLPDLKKIVLSHEDQLDNFMEIRRMMPRDIWAFLRPGEGEVAEFVAISKMQEVKSARIASNFKMQDVLAQSKSQKVELANAKWGESTAESAPDYDSEDEVNDDRSDTQGEGRMETTYGSIDLMDDTLPSEHTLEPSSFLVFRKKKSGKSVTIVTPDK